MQQLTYQLTSLYFSLNKYGQNTTDRYERFYRQEAAHKCKEKYIDKLKKKCFKWLQKKMVKVLVVQALKLQPPPSSQLPVLSINQVMFVYGVCALDLLVIGACVFFA